MKDPEIQREFFGCSSPLSVFSRRLKKPTFSLLWLHGGGSDFYALSQKMAEFFPAQVVAPNRNLHFFVAGNFARLNATTLCTV